MAISILENVDCARMSEVTFYLLESLKYLLLQLFGRQNTSKQYFLYQISTGLFVLWLNCLPSNLEAWLGGYGFKPRLSCTRNFKYGAHCLLVCCWTWKNGVGKLATCVANRALSSYCSLNCIRRLMT